MYDELSNIIRDEARKRVWPRNWLSKRSLGASCRILKELYDHDSREYKTAMRITAK